MSLGRRLICRLQGHMIFRIALGGDVAYRCARCKEEW